MWNGDFWFDDDDDYDNDNDDDNSNNNDSNDDKRNENKHNIGKKKKKRRKLSVHKKINGFVRKAPILLYQLPRRHNPLEPNFELPEENMLHHMGGAYLFGKCVSHKKQYCSGRGYDSFYVVIDLNGCWCFDTTTFKIFFSFSNLTVFSETLLGRFSL